jgi:hypothetical protein
MDFLLLGDVEVRAGDAGLVALGSRQRPAPIAIRSCADHGAARSGVRSAERAISCCARGRLRKRQRRR